MTTSRISQARSKGFTLYELMITLVVAGTILSFGVPSFMNIIQNNRATTHTNDLVTALNLARSEAIRRASGVTLCASADAATCSGDTDWTTGWIVRSDAGEVLRAWPARSGGDGIVTGSVSQVRFLARGELAAGAADIDVRLPDCSGQQARAISVNAAGRISVAREDCE